ncbi:MAG: pyrroline-5-carboxylate reductase [Luminiphilus sp.]|nr:pyrroline-5-carboxylate reductase [Luminiphilus sp.]
MSPQIAFLGAGNMASAIISGLLAVGFSPQQLSASDPSEEALERLRALGLSRVSTATDNLCHGADLLVAAVKPQVMAEALMSVSPQLSSATALFSIAAGIPISSLQSMAGASVPIVRCMPNTPAMIGQGASALFASESVTAAQRKIAEQLTNAVGFTVWVEQEELLDAVTAVSGSGPAYFFALIESISKAGTELGLSPEVSMSLTLHTALGAAELARQSDVPIGALRENVTSPGGTTEQALLALQAEGFDEIVAKAVHACADRARTLGEEFG